MNRILSVKLAATIMLVLFGMLAVLQVLVLAGVVPLSMVWGGQLDNENDEPVFYIAPLFTLLALLALVAFGLMVALRAGWLGRPGIYRWSHILMWVLVAYFALNTVGNLAAASRLESCIFTPVTIVLVLLSLRLALQKPTT